MGFTKNNAMYMFWSAYTHMIKDIHEEISETM